MPLRESHGVHGLLAADLLFHRIVPGQENMSLSKHLRLGLLCFLGMEAGRSGVRQAGSVCASIPELKVIFSQFMTNEKSSARSLSW